MKRALEEHEAIARDFCKLQKTETLIDSFVTLERMLDETPNVTELRLSRAWIFDELDKRGELGRVGICNDCYSDVVDCECEGVGFLVFKCRDLGYGAEEGEGTYVKTGEIDTWGKWTFVPRDGSPAIYLFEDEIVSWGQRVEV